MAKITHNTPEQAIECIKAHIAGKRIQATRIGCDAFIYVESPTWDFAHYRYEVMREPRTFYVNEYTGGFGLGFKLDEAEAIERGKASHNYIKTVKFIEVME